ncbi:MAG: hypothetical protein E7057_03095 [Lentisphaerae bacterium]|nr:hypothetical protein [Lentisphaerota bacterium]
MKNFFQGNIVSADHAGYGRVMWHDAVITHVEFSGEVRGGADWIVPGFIDTHVHGLGNADVSASGVVPMSGFFPKFGVTGFLPTLDTVAPATTLAFLKEVKEASAAVCGARVLGSHLEGPFLSAEFAGGMDHNQLRMPDVEEVDSWIGCAEGSLKLVTLAPELPGASEVIRKLSESGVIVSLGHTAMKAAELPQAISAGVSRMCHIFDAYDGRHVENGVSMPSLTDAALICNQLMLEIIMDGVHVPAELVRLAIRAAGTGRVIAISDAMMGTGLPDGIYPSSDGRMYKLDNHDVCRELEPPYRIFGSCLTMNRAFNNLIRKFGCTPVEAVQMTSANPARSIGLGDKYGTLLPGFTADITVLADDMLTVKSTVINGDEVLN